MGATVNDQVRIRTLSADAADAATNHNPITNGDGGVASLLSKTHVQQAVIQLPAMLLERVAESTGNIVLVQSESSMASPENGVVPTAADFATAPAEDAKAYIALQSLPLEKYTTFVGEMKDFPQGARIYRATDGRLQTFTLGQRFVATILPFLFGVFYPEAKAGMQKIREDISAVLKEWGESLPALHKDKIQKLSLNANTIKDFFEKVNHSEAFNINTQGEVSMEGRAAYAKAVKTLWTGDIVTKHELKTEVWAGTQQVEGREQPVFENLAVPLDGQFVKDNIRSSYKIGDELFFDRKAERYLGQSLNEAVAGSDKPKQNANDFLAKGFIAYLKAEFNATDQEITVLSYLVSQRGTAILTPLISHGYLALPKGTLPIPVSSDFVITKTENGYRIGASYEGRNPAIMNLNDNRDGVPSMYLFSTDTNRNDFFRVSVVLDFKMEEDTPVINLAKDPIRYAMHIKMDENGQWV